MAGFAEGERLVRVFLHPLTRAHAPWFRCSGRATTGVLALWRGIDTHGPFTTKDKWSGGPEFFSSREETAFDGPAPLSLSLVEVAEAAELEDESSGA